METLQDFTSKENQLKAQLAQLEQERIQAIERAKQEKLGLITTYENEAVGYRNQAEKATTDEDKRKLYGFANNADNLANELRAELGLEPVTNEVISYQDTRNKTLRKINSLLLKAGFALLAFFISDFTAGRLESGFFSYALESLAQITYFMSAAFGGCWLVCTLLFGFVSDYTINELSDDFRSLRPEHKLLLLAGLGAALLHFLNAVIPHAI